MKRSKHSLSHYKLATFDMAELVPVGHFEVLPGDSVRQVTSALIRVSPLNFPVMHPIQVRIHHWFVPYRLLWTGWEDFITGGTDGLGDGVGAVPTISSGAGFTAGELADYFGIPPGVASQTVLAFLFRAYSMIWNEFYRDQDLMTPRPISLAGGNDPLTPTTLAKIAWEKDYFTAARPWTQRGPAVTIPLGSSAPVVNNGTAVQFAENAAGTTNPFTMGRLSNTANSSLIAPPTGTALASLYYKSGLQADLSAAVGPAVNDVRRLFALQRYAEARALYGARYTEYLRYLGVRSSDARLQRPEYLGGGKQTISFSEVLQTAEGTNSVGTMRGHGISAVRSNAYIRYFEEHGVVLSLASVRPKAMYTNGVHRSWLRTTKEDFWQKELETIGQQPIQNQEVYAAAATKTGTFGYTNRYDDYRSLPSTVAGDFRSTLNVAHMARIFGSEPVLNSSFVTCDPTKRIHAVGTNDVLWCLFNHSIQARRLVSRVATRRIV